MARIRTIKPELLRHEGLFEAERASGLPLRLAFAGLFTTADREGRFKWRPRELKLDVLPYDDVDFSKVLEGLRVGGFVVRYEVDGAVYGYIPSWGRHQHINNREAASTLPAPPDPACDARVDDASLSRDERVDGASITHAPRVDDAPSTPLVQEQGEGKGKEGKGKEGESFALVGGADQVADEDKRIACPHAKLIAMFSERVPELPKPRAELWTGSPAKDMQARWRWVLTAKRATGDRYATSADEALAWFGKFFDAVKASDFLSGRSGKWTNCSLQWLMKATNFAKVVEGTYDNNEREAA
jgi:hypothetical protein